MRVRLACSLVLFVALVGCSAGPLADLDGTEAREVPAPYDDLDAETVTETHRERLRAAENATMHVATTRRSTDPAEPNRSEERTASLDLTTDPATRHVVAGDGRERWVDPDRTLERDADGRYSRYGTPGTSVEGVDTVVGNFEYGPPERVERDGRTVFRYRAEGFDSVAAEEPEPDSDVTVHRVASTVLVRPDGLVLEAWYTYDVETPDGRVTADFAVRYTDVGSTDVTRPPWYEDAVEAVGPTPDETVTVTDEVAAFDAALTVTGAARNVSSEFALARPVALSAAEPPVFAADPLAAAQVSCLVRVRLPSEYESAELTLTYDESHVPGGDEAGLTVLQYRARGGSFRTADVVDAAANQATASVDANGYYAVVHEPTFETAYLAGDEPPATAPPPACGTGRSGDAEGSDP